MKKTFMALLILASGSLGLVGCHHAKDVHKHDSKKWTKPCVSKSKKACSLKESSYASKASSYSDCQKSCCYDPYGKSL